MQTLKCEQCLFISVRSFAFNDNNDDKLCTALFFTKLQNDSPVGPMSAILKCLEGKLGIWVRELVLSPLFI